ncbi:aminodeoxychorismate lyase [Shewanella donghaensis]|uniref:aminodeoxychorismate lyase n=1 Tax=Shewanella donghaensis TaxID=238836 RepID=UPI001183FF76|nr:aminodeoxychorismate lyase [Shewanella donghaensis]
MTSIFVNGLPQHHVNSSDRGLAYGDGAFATMRVSHSQVLFIYAHIERLKQACLRLGFTLQHQSELTLQLEEHAKTLKNGCIKLLVSRGVGGRGYTAPSSVEQTEVISLHQIPAIYQQWQQHGISLSVSDVTLARQPLLAGMKHLNRLEQVLIKQHDLPTTFDDWLVLDTEGFVVESSMANVFIVENDSVITPSLSYSGVSGVMREQVMGALLDSHINVFAEPISLKRLYETKHVFITNSLLGIVDINKVNHCDFSTWSFSRNLLKKLKLSF